MKPIKHIKITKNMKASSLIEEFSNAGFGAVKIAKASEILVKIIKDKECKLFLGLAGAMVPAGMKDIIIDLLNYTDVFVTTGANLTHDLIEALGHKHYKGTLSLKDSELNKKGIDRIYNVFMKNEVYQSLEDFFSNLGVPNKKMNIKEFLWFLGSNLKEKNSILYTCYNKKIPIFCPAISDSGIGLMIWSLFNKNKNIEVDTFLDLKEIIDIAWTSKKSAVLYVGGGTPKNYIQQAMQLSKGASYGIQITTDRPEPGGSSGAPLKEGISWGKMKENAEFIDVFCDATIALPLIYAYVKDKI